MWTHFALASALLALPGVAFAEVKSASPTHFILESKAVVATSAADAYAMLGRIGADQGYVRGP